MSLNLPPELHILLEKLNSCKENAFSLEDLSGISTYIDKNGIGALEIQILEIIIPAILCQLQQNDANSLSNIPCAEYLFGILSFLNNLLKHISNVSTQCSSLGLQMVKTMFLTLCLCDEAIFYNDSEGGIFKDLIVNISAAILFQDIVNESMEILMGNLLQDNACVAILTLEVCTLVLSNIPSENCLVIFVHLLYEVNNLLCGFFTHRPEIVYLKCLLRRIFQTMPEDSKHKIAMIFSSGSYIQVWRFLGLSQLNAQDSEVLLKPILENAEESIESINNGLDDLDEDVPLNIVEGLNILSTVTNLKSDDPKLKKITKFLLDFWNSDVVAEDISNNNLLAYFLTKTCRFLSIYFQEFILDSKRVLSQMKKMSDKNTYYMCALNIFSDLINCMSSNQLNKQKLLNQAASVINALMESGNNIIIKENCLELLKNLNSTHQDELNILLDTLNPSISNQIFQYLQKTYENYPKDINYNRFTTKNKYQHKCLRWRENTIPQPPKRAKMDFSSIKVRKFQPEMVQKKCDIVDTTDVEDDVPAEVIDRLKGEVKCLMKVCQKEKLSAKNVAHLRILISQLSSLT